MDLVARVIYLIVHPIVVQIHNVYYLLVIQSFVPGKIHVLKNLALMLSAPHLKLIAQVIWQVVDLMEHNALQHYPIVVVIVEVAKFVKVYQMQLARDAGWQMDQMGHVQIDNVQILLQPHPRVIVTPSLLDVCGMGQDVKTSRPHVQDTPISARMLAKQSKLQEGPAAGRVIHQLQHVKLSHVPM